MTIIQKFGDLYRVSEPWKHGYHVRYCTLEEVLYILSTPERSEGNDQKLVGARRYAWPFRLDG